MFAKGRNEIQASIEDMAQAIKNLAYDINEFYTDKIKTIESKIEEVKKQNVDLADEEIGVVNFYNYQLLEIYSNLHIEAMEAIVSKVYSYAETHMQMIVENIGFNSKKVSKEYSKDGQPEKGVSDVEKMFYIIKKYYSLPYSALTDVWNSFHDIHKLRNDIVHKYNHERQYIKVEYIIQNLDQVEEMLKVIECVVRTSKEAK